MRHELEAWTAAASGLWARSVLSDAAGAQVPAVHAQPAWANLEVRAAFAAICDVANWRVTAIILINHTKSSIQTRPLGETRVAAHGLWQDIAGSR